MLVDKLRKNVRIYGPYVRKDGRKHVIVYDGVTRRTVSYPKWLMEQHLGRFLNDDETVDHIDRDFTNNTISNLQILTRSKHASLDAKRVKKVTVSCIECGVSMVREPKRLHENASNGKAGPFCKSCAGRYGTDLQNKRIARKPAQKAVPRENRDYYFLDKKKSKW